MIRKGRSAKERRCPHCREWIDVRAWARHVAAHTKSDEERRAEANFRRLLRRENL